MGLRGCPPVVPCRTVKPASDETFARIEHRARWTWPRRSSRRIERIAPHHVVIAEIFGEGRDPRCHHRHATRHRFEHHEAEALLRRGKHQASWRRGRARASAPAARDRCGSRPRPAARSVQARRKSAPDRRHGRAARRRPRSPGGTQDAAHGRCERLQAAGSCSCVLRRRRPRETPASRRQAEPSAQRRIRCVGHWRKALDIHAIADDDAHRDRARAQAIAATRRLTTKRRSAAVIERNCRAERRSSSNVSTWCTVRAKPWIRPRSLSVARAFPEIPSWACQMSNCRFRAYSKWRR